MTRDVDSTRALRDSFRADVREASGVWWWWYLILGILWIGLGMFVLSYRVGSLAVVVTFIGIALLFGGISQLVVASQVQSGRGLLIVAGILGVAAGIMAFVWPDATLYVASVLVAWYLVIFGVVHIVSALAGPKLPWWWTGLLLGIAELVLGVWAVRSWERSVVTLVTLVGVWAVVRGVNDIFAAFAGRQAGREAQRLVG
jgi:uncharacterized membrane protein HdeD (DUF308 family)